MPHPQRRRRPMLSELLPPGTFPVEMAPAPESPAMTPGRSECYNCGTHCLGEYMTTSRGRSYCTYCYNHLFIACQGCSTVKYRYDMVHYDGHYWCQDCLLRLRLTCQVCGESYNLHSSSDLDGAHICPACFRSRYVHCRHCGRAVERDHAHGTDNGQLCGPCYNDHLSREWDAPAYSANLLGPCSEVGSGRCYGVEIETHRCDTYRELYGKTPFGCKPDCSIEGMEFVSPILRGDEGAEIIREFCREAAARYFKVNSSCGLHVHFDLSGESVDNMRKIASAYAKTYPIWLQLVAIRRRDNTMCGPPDYLAATALTEDWEYFVAKRDRFEYVNWRAYLVHGTVEIRLYQGSIDAEEINRWVAIHARFIDASTTFDVTDWDNFTWADMEAIVGPSLFNFWDEKRNQLCMGQRPRATVPNAYATVPNAYAIARAFAPAVPDFNAHQGLGDDPEATDDIEWTDHFRPTRQGDPAPVWTRTPTDYSLLDMENYAEDTNDRLTI